MRIERATEQLRQERATFEQMRLHVRRWFNLRLCMGYVGISLMALIAMVSTYVILNPERYESSVLSISASALFIDLVSLAVSIFRLVLHHGSSTKLEPVTYCRELGGSEASDDLDAAGVPTGPNPGLGRPARSESLCQ